MGFTQYLLRGAGYYALIGLFVIVCFHYYLVLGSILFDSSFGNKAYTIPIIWQVIAWWAWFGVIVAYQKYCEHTGKAIDKHPLSPAAVMGYVFIGITILGLILAELYSGLLRRGFVDMIDYLTLLLL